MGHFNSVEDAMLLTLAISPKFFLPASRALYQTTLQGPFAPQDWVVIIMTKKKEEIIGIMGILIDLSLYFHSLVINLHILPQHNGHVCLGLLHLPVEILEIEVPGDISTYLDHSSWYYQHHKTHWVLEESK